MVSTDVNEEDVVVVDRVEGEDELAEEEVVVELRLVEELDWDELELWGGAEELDDTELDDTEAEPVEEVELELESS